MNTDELAIEALRVAYRRLPAARACAHYLPADLERLGAWLETRLREADRAGHARGRAEATRELTDVIDADFRKAAGSIVPRRDAVAARLVGGGGYRGGPVRWVPPGSGGA